MEGGKRRDGATERGMLEGRRAAARHSAPRLSLATGSRRKLCAPGACLASGSGVHAVSGQHLAAGPIGLAPRDSLPDRSAAVIAISR